MTRPFATRSGDWYAGSAVLWAGLLLVPLLARADSAVTESTPVTILAGQHQILRIANVSGVRSGNGALVEAKLIGPGEVMITGLRGGEATLIVDRPGEPQTLFAISVLDSAPPPDGDRQLETIQLGVGHQAVLRVNGVKRIAVGDPKVADVQVVSSGEVLVTGVGEGRTTLLFWQGNDERTGYLVDVGKPLQESLNEIKRLLGPMEGIQLRIVGERIFLDGDFESREDLERAQQVCKLYEKVLYCMPRPE